MKTTPTKKTNKVKSLHVSPSRETIIVEPMSLKDFQPQIFLSTSERKSRQAHKNAVTVVNSSKTPQKETSNSSSSNQGKPPSSQQNPPKSHESTAPTPIIIHQHTNDVTEEEVSENNNSETVLNHAKQLYIEYQGGLEEIPEESQISNMSGSIASFTKEPMLADLDLSSSRRLAESSPRDEFIELTKSVEFTKKKSSIVKETIVLQEIQSTEEKPDDQIREIEHLHQAPIEVTPQEIEQTQSLEMEKRPELQENSQNNDEIIPLSKPDDESERTPSPLLNNLEEVQKNEPEFLEKSNPEKNKIEEDEDLQKKNTVIQPNIPEPQVKADLLEADSTAFAENKLVSPTHKNTLVQSTGNIKIEKNVDDDDDNLPPAAEIIQNTHDSLKKEDQIQEIRTNTQIQGDLPDPPKISLEPSLNLIKEDPPVIPSENQVQKESAQEPAQESVPSLDKEKEIVAQEIQKQEDAVKEVIPEPVVIAIDQAKKDEAQSPSPPQHEKESTPQKAEAETVMKNNSSSENLKQQDEEHKVEAKTAKKFAVPAFLKHNAQKPTTTTAATTLPDENHNKLTAAVTGKVDDDHQDINKKPVIEDPQTLIKAEENKKEEIIPVPKPHEDHKPSENINLKNENPSATTTQGLQLDKMSVGSDSSKDLKAEPTKPLTPSKPKFTVPKFLKKGGAASEKNSVQSQGQNHETGSNTSATPALEDFDVDESKKRSSSNAHQQKPENTNINSQNDIKDKRSQSHSTLPLTSDSEKILKSDGPKSGDSNENTVVQQQQQPKEDNPNPQPEKNETKIENNEPKAPSTTEDANNNKANSVEDKNDNKPQAPPEEVDKSKEVNPPSQDTIAKPPEKKFAPPKFTAPKFGKKT